LSRTTPDRSAIVGIRITYEQMPSLAGAMRRIGAAFESRSKPYSTGRPGHSGDHAAESGFCHVTLAARWVARDGRMVIGGTAAAVLGTGMGLPLLVFFPHGRGRWTCVVRARWELPLRARFAVARTVLSSDSSARIDELERRPALPGERAKLPAGNLARGVGQVVRDITLECGRRSRNEVDAPGCDHGAMLLSACFPTTTRPAFLPQPMAAIAEVHLGIPEATRALALALHTDSIPIRRTEPKDGWLESEWFDAKTLRPTSARRLGPDVVKVRAWIGPARSSDRTDKHIPSRSRRSTGRWPIRHVATANSSPGARDASDCRPGDWVTLAMARAYGEAGTRRWVAPKKP